jgi:anthranilate phosphoribosyltransferase
LDKLLERRDLEETEAEFALREIMGGKTNNPQVSAFLTTLKMKGETAGEIAAFARAMGESAIGVLPRAGNLVDTAGTGGDGCGTFNVSTCAALVAAGAGATVAKHGNRAVSGRSGSADVLEELGVNIAVAPQTAKEQLETIGVSFLFAPSFHPAMRTVAQVRRELGFRTVFNLLGPLTNPAGAKRQVVGVYEKPLLEKMAGALKALGTEKALVVCSDTDEIGISGETEVYEVSGDGIEHYAICPEDFGFKRSGIASILAPDRAKSAETILGVLNGRQGPARDITLLNAGAAIYASGVAGSLGKGVSAAGRAIDSGRALRKLELLKGFGK